ncbi:efflux RND transporter periplasmic adaptor subunit [Chitinophaga sp. MM2321]|uniref:efflux RND transporter periplasmic adaptor subunit n=1 Tax=Chitinophaga sp. MM2321 TaxID=3137178 RepID=UPI0032D5832C
MHFKSSVIIFATFLVTGSVLLTACSSSGQQADKSAEKKEVPAVKAATVLEDRPVYTLTLPGELKPYEQVNLYAKVKSFVRKLYVDRGSVVKKGQLLAVLDALEINQQYLSNKSGEEKLYADYMFSKQSYERLLQAAAKNGAVAAIELERAKSRLQSDSAAYVAAIANTGAAAQLNDYLRIVAPFDGVITSRHISQGALVGDGGALPLFSLAQNKRLRLTVLVPEKHARSLGTDTKVSFTVSDRPGQLYHASLSRNAGLLDENDRSITVEFDVDNSTNQLSGGAYAQVKLLLQRPDSTLWVPLKSVVHAQSGVFVLKINNYQTLSRINVIEGTKKDSLQEIFGDIQPSDRVVAVASEENL